MAIVAIDRSGRIQHINRFLAELSGHRLEEVVGRDWFDTFLPERDRSRIREKFQMALTLAPTRGNRNPIITRAGKERDFEWNDEVLRDVHGQVTGLVAIGQDVTEQVRAERLARESEERCRKLMEHSSKVVALYDADTRILYQSPSVRDVLGYEPEEMIGRLAFEYCHPDDLPAIRERMPEVLSTPGAIGKIELRSRCKDGSYRWLELIAANRLHDPTIRAVVGSFRDISAEKAAEETLRLSERRFRKLIENCADAIALYDAAGIVLDRVPTSAAMLGYRSDELVGKSAFDYCHPDDVPLAKAALQRVLELPERSGKFELRCRTKDGAYRWVEVIATNQLHEPAVQAIVGNYRDITERKESEAREAARLAKLRRLSELSMQLSGDPAAVFENVVRMIGELFAVSVVCLSEVQGDELLFKTVYANGEVVADAGRCPLQITPCATVKQSRDVHVFNRVAERFPLATFLREHDAWTYCGFPAIDADGDVIAVICLLDPAPQDFSAEDKELLRLFGQRVAIELRRGKDLAANMQAQVALKESEERLRLALSSANQGLWDLHVQTGETDTSLEYARMLGYEPEGFVETNARWLERLHPDDAERVAENYRRYVSGEIPEYSVEFRQRTAQGNWKWILSQGRIVSRDELGRPVRMAGTHTDISATKAAEQSIRDSAERFRALFAAAPIPVVLTDLNGRYVAVNPAFETSTGFAAAELVGRTSIEVGLIEADRQAVAAAELLQSVGQLDGIEILTRTKSGAIRNYLYSARVVNLAGESRVLSMAVDITERKRAEELLRASEQRLAEAQRIAQLGNWYWDAATDLLTWSEEIFRIFGLEPGAITPRFQVEFQQAVHPDDRQALAEASTAALETGQPYTFEHRICRPDGTERVVREKGEVVFDENGQPKGMVGTVQDITERTEADAQMKLLRDELAHVARLGTLGELAAGIAHELNQPLAAIANYAFSLQSSLSHKHAIHPQPPLEQELSLTARIEEQATRGGEIIRRLQALIHNKPSQRSTVCLGRLLEEVLVLLAADLRLAQIEVAVDVAERLPPVLVDPVQIQQVLFNLIRNSIESLRHQSTTRCLNIEIGLEQGAMLLIRVRDSGAGVPAEMRPRLFTPFSTSKPQGLGLGLPISKRIVEYHGGEIRWNAGVESGFEICFSLPIADGESRPYE